MSASTITELAYLFGRVGSPDPRFDVPRDAYISDWSIDDLAELLFLETATDIAVVHDLPLCCYTDGMVSLEKAAEAVNRYPDRFRAHAGIDPLRDKVVYPFYERAQEHGIKVVAVQSRRRQRARSGSPCA